MKNNKIYNKIIESVRNEVKKTLNEMSPSRKTINVEKIIAWAEESAKELEEGSDACYFYRLGDSDCKTGQMYIVMGWSGGFDPEPEHPSEYRICVKLAYNSDDLQSDYDIDWEMPYDEETGDVDDTNSTYDGPADIEYLVKYWSKNYAINESRSVKLPKSVKTLNESVMTEHEKWERRYIDELDKSYELVYTDYNDNFTDCGKEIQKCIDHGDCYPLYEHDNEWFGDARYRNAREIMNDVLSIVKERLTDEIDDDAEAEELSEAFDAWADENDIDLMDYILERDESDPIGDCMRRTQLFGRLDYEDSFYLSYEEIDFSDKYFNQILNILGLNPKDVADYIRDNFESEVTGKVQDIPGLEPKVDLKEFVDCCMGEYSDAYLTLTFFGFLPLDEMYNKGFVTNGEEITIPAKTDLVLFDRINGGGGVEVQTIKPITIKIDKNWRIVVDGKDGYYSLDGTYGFSKSGMEEIFHFA